MVIIRHIVNFQSFTPLPNQGASSGLGTLGFSIIKAEDGSSAGLGASSGGAAVELTFDGVTEQGSWRVNTPLLHAEPCLLNQADAHAVVSPTNS
ncbi:hypothetical protein M427DRAFT_322627 [Gonapodya prolifera JEL478]|uniref:Uncharacterized protein n=1 Tax=Gonapodya prolifera (strain JEL478) TaxID=1344416 RepID=A0A139AFM7_GONPJ|nr:hypothetical protein M427DRAFT_322627 [Gonapodya prolifera JEL478]|eukprot:KXS15560.1 hypothetical protein M427DRAFT_322627 [Gonapodya prolifera JEL478]